MSVQPGERCPMCGRQSAAPSERTRNKLVRNEGVRIAFLTGARPHEIARALGIPLWRVYNAIEAMGLRDPKRCAREQQILGLFNASTRAPIEIARRLNLNVETVYRDLERLGLRRRRRQPRYVRAPEVHDAV